MVNERVSEAVKAIRSGDRRRARRLLGQVVNDDPENVAAWWYLSAVLEDTDQRIRCLRRVISLRPDHAEAKEMLNRLERRLGTVTPPGGTERPVIETYEDDSGEMVAEVEEVEDEQPDNDIAVVGAVVLIALAAIVVTIIFVFSGQAEGVLGIQGSDLDPTAIPIVFDVPACSATGEEGARLVFINNTAVDVDILRGPQDRETLVLSLGAGEQGTVDTSPGRAVRFATATETEGMAGTGAILEVPAGSTCRVPIQ